METNKKKTRSDLLKELESIKGLLLDDHDIPVLQEIIEHKAAIAAENNYSRDTIEDLREAELEVLKHTYQTLAGDNTAAGAAAEESHSNADAQPTPDQAAAAKPLPITKPQANPQPQARGENPFLPQHIRARLRGNRMDFSLPDMSDDASVKAQLINQIIRELLPELESQLRKHLLALTDDALQQLVHKAAKEQPSK